MTIFNFPGLAARSGPFVDEVRSVATSLSIDPNWLLTIMQLESGIDPKATNKQGGATGLIQFMPATAKAYGTTTDALRSMSDVKQLEYVRRFYARYSGKIDSVGTLYMLAFYPSMAFEPRETVIARKGEPVYDQNVVLDADKNGVLTVGDVKSKAENALYLHSLRGPFVPRQGMPESVKDGVTSNVIAMVIVAGGLWLYRRAKK